MKSILKSIVHRSSIILSMLLVSLTLAGSFVIVTSLIVAGATEVQAQNLKVTLYVTSHPPPDLSDWTGRKDVTIVTILNSGPAAVQAKFNCTVSKNGALVAATKPESMATITIPPGSSQWYGEDLVPFEAVRFVGNVDRTVAQTGKLPAGTYTFCVSLLDPKSLKELTTPVCRDFSIISYQAPVLLQPTDRSTVAPGVRPLFRWTPVTPRPTTQVSYHLRIFEVLPGQTPINAYKVNQPILDRDQIVLTQLLWPPDYDMPQPGMQYVWSVQATDPSGAAIGDPDGTATPFSFTARKTATTGGRGGSNDSTGSGNNTDDQSSGFGSNTSGRNSSGGNTSGGNNGGADSLLKGNQPFTQGPNALTGAQSQVNGLIAVTPKNDAQLNIRDKKPNFSWRWKGDAPAQFPPGYYQLELEQVATKKHFSVKLSTLLGEWPSSMPFEEGNYLWKVTALSASGGVLGSSGPQTFSVMSNNYQIQYSVDSILCTDTIGLYHFSVTLCNTGILPITFTPSDLTALDDITGLPDPNIVLTVTTPSSMVTLNAPNCITINGTIKNLGTKLTGILQIRTNRVGGNILASEETENDTLPTCICTKCDSLKIDTTKGKAAINPKNGHLQITQPLTVGPAVMTGLTADVIYVGWQPDDPKCMPCDKDPKQWGVLTKAVFAGLAGTITPNEAHWNFSPTKHSGTASFDINLPQLLSCCKLHGNVCIRYKFYLKSDPGGDCFECERVICYSF